MSEPSKIHRLADGSPVAWSEFIEAMHSGRRFECDEAIYWYWLEVLPPVWMNRKIALDNQIIPCTFGFCEGYDYVTAFWREGERYFGQRTSIMNTNG